MSYVDRVGPRAGQPFEHISSLNSRSAPQVYEILGHGLICFGKLETTLELASETLGCGAWRCCVCRGVNVEAFLNSELLFQGQNLLLKFTLFFQDLVKSSLEMMCICGRGRHHGAGPPHLACSLIVF